MCPPHPPTPASPPLPLEGTGRVFLSSLRFKNSDKHGGVCVYVGGRVFCARGRGSNYCSRERTVWVCVRELESQPNPPTSQLLKIPRLPGCCHCLLQTPLTLVTAGLCLGFPVVRGCALQARHSPGGSWTGPAEPASVWPDLSWHGPRGQGEPLPLTH